MKRVLEENKGIPASLLWMLAIIAGISVANLYYNQPLLNKISEDLRVSEFTANLIPMTTQIGYALGLLFIIPLGDLYKRRNIIVINFLLLSVSMLGFAVAQNIYFCFTGFADYGHLLCHATDFHSDSSTVFTAGKESTKCRSSGKRTADRNPWLAGCKWYCRRILGMENHFLHCFCINAYLHIRYCPHIA